MTGDPRPANIERGSGDIGKPVGDGVTNVGNTVEGAGQGVAQSAKDAGQWKTT